MFKKILISFLFFTAFSAYLIAANTHYVNTKTLKVRIAPTTDSLHLYSIYKGHQVKIFETYSSWARVSRYKSSLDDDGQIVKTATWVHKDYLKKIDKKTLKKKIKKLPKKKEIVKIKQVPKKEKIVPVKKVEAPVIKKPTPQPKTNVVKVVAEKVIPTKEITQEEPILVEEEVQPEERPFDKYTFVLKAISTSVDYEKFQDQFISHSKRLFDNGTCKLKDFKRAKGWVELADDTLYFIYCGKIKRANKIYLNVITGQASK